MKKIDPKAVLIGFSADLGVTVIAGILIGVGELVVFGEPLPHSEKLTNIPFLLLNLIAGFFGTFVGGYVTAKRSSREPLFNSIAVGFFGILFYGLFLFFSVEFAPFWYHVVAFALIIPVSYFGGTVALKRMGNA